MCVIEAGKKKGSHMLMCADGKFQPVTNEEAGGGLAATARRKKGALPGRLRKKLSAAKQAQAAGQVGSSRG